MEKMKLYTLLIIAIALLPISFIGCNSATRINLEQALETVNSATMEIDSYHMTRTTTTTNAGGFTQRTEYDFVSPDRTRSVMYEQGIKENESRVIGDSVYTWSDNRGSWRLMEEPIAEHLASNALSMGEHLEKQYTAERLEECGYIDELPDEIIDGVNCEHYRGEIQVNSEGITSQMLEIWIGRVDHILRQTRWTFAQTMDGDTGFGDTQVPEGTTVTFTITSTYTNFNEPVEIEAPISAEISRLSLPERNGGYDNFASTMIRSESDLNNFISDIQQLDDWYGRTEFLANVAEWQIDFSTHSLILCRHAESSGGTVVVLHEPVIQGGEVIIGVSKGVIGRTADMAYYCYAYKVSKNSSSVTFIRSNKKNLCFQLTNGEIVIED